MKRASSCDLALKLFFFFFCWALAMPKQLVQTPIDARVINLLSFSFIFFFLPLLLSNQLKTKCCYISTLLRMQSSASPLILDFFIFCVLFPIYEYLSINPLFNSPSILIPSLDLTIAQLQFVCQFHAILYAQIFLTFKWLFQRLQLMIGKSGACLALFLG